MDTKVQLPFFAMYFFKNDTLARNKLNQSTSQRTWSLENF